MAASCTAQDSLDDADIAGQADSQDDDAGDADAQREALLQGRLVVWKWREAMSLRRAASSLVSVSQSRRPRPRESILQDSA